jgi:hypothetical protein
MLSYMLYVHVLFVLKSQVSTPGSALLTACFVHVAACSITVFRALGILVLAVAAFGPLLGFTPCRQG